MMCTSNLETVFCLVMVDKERSLKIWQLLIDITITQSFCTCRVTLTENVEVKKNGQMLIKY